MSSPVYKKVTLIGTSRQSIEGAVQNAVATASKSLRHLSWFEIKQVRGHIAGGKIDSYQVEVAIGFSLEGQEDDVHIMTAL
ncbi:dodecin [Emcibacter sp. SYSU 3D8]|uniref:dodecin n=1 Tax=Emcibacter sp. SYSU 3D8 TaxID=3133969 RepID=UPI0031FEC82B